MEYANMTHTGEFKPTSTDLIMFLSELFHGLHRFLPNFHGYLRKHTQFFEAQAAFRQASGIQTSQDWIDRILGAFGNSGSGFYQ